MKKNIEKINENKRMRLDLVLVEKGFISSRSKAKEMIERGMVSVNGIVEKKPNASIENEDKLEILNTLPFVGRGGEKIEEAFIKWLPDLTGKIIIDIGSSTGGFTDAALKRNAKKVYAVDVGHNQLDQKLKDNSRVISMEGTDIRNLNSLPEEVDLAIIDVSFISLSSVLPNTSKLLKKNGEIIALVKPQFEVGYGETKKGIVKDEKKYETVLVGIKRLAESCNLSCVDLIDSPIKGKHGNKEFLLYLKRV